MEVRPTARKKLGKKRWIRSKAAGFSGVDFVEL